MKGNHSDVANLMAAIDEQNTAAWNALYGPAEGTTRHQFISARYGDIWQIKDQLAEHVGEEQAIAMVIQQLNGGDGK